MWSDETVKSMLIALTIIGGPAAVRGEEERERERDLEARQEDRTQASGDAAALGPPRRR